MIDYILNDILNEIDIHFRMQDIFKKANKTNYEHMNTKRYDLYSNYLYYCNLHDIQTSTTEFNLLLEHVTWSLSNKGYNSLYNTDTELLEISRD